ncbi:MAG: HAMP domain-containing protein [Clostridia bacterium]|nr:HAMP domain-containing protein [Clostridia bacterium]
MGLIQRYTLTERKRETVKEANILATFAQGAVMEEKEAIAFLPETYSDTAGKRIMLLDKDGRVVLDTGDAAQKGKIMAAPYVLEAVSGKNTVFETETDGLHYLQAAVPVYSGHAIVGALCFKASTEDLYDYFDHIRFRLLVISICGSLLIGLFGVFISALFTKPISKVTGQIKEMSETDTRHLVHVRGGNEITELVSAFNLMVERINDIDARRQEFVSNASHELKTPLSSIKLICDSLLQNPETDRETVNEFLGDMNEQVDRLTRIVNKLLSLTKLDSSVEESEIFTFSTVNIGLLMQNVVKALLPLAQSKNIMIETRLDENVFLRVDADKIWEAVYNILDNSIKYTPEDGRVYAELYRDEKNVYITVSDSGIGMAETEINKIFDRFYRVDKARARETGGTGLGLSIALSAVELHGGYIEVESREEEGSLFRIVLPVTTDL